MSASKAIASKPRALNKLTAIAAAAALVGAGLTYSAPDASAAQATASDSFTRAVAKGWGSATSGGAYSSWSSRGVAMSVASGKAKISGMTAKKSAVATLKNVSAADVTASGDFSFSSLPGTGANTYTGLETRRQADGSVYRGRLIVGSGGTAKLDISRVNAGKETGLGSYTLPFKVKANQAVRVEFKATGTTKVDLSMRAWVVGQSAPGWQLNKSDSSTSRLAKAGNFGFWTYASAKHTSKTNISVDNLKLAKATATATTPPTPPTKPVDPVAPVTNPKRGTATVGSASYAVPSNAIYVAPSSSGAQSGTKSNPYTSLQKAIDAAADGQTIVLRAGTYHQSAKVPMGKDKLTIQNYPGEKVWMDGTKKVTNWKKSGSTWASAGWTPSFSNKIMGVANNSRFVDSKYPMAARPDMLFINGAPQKQVASASQVVAGTFAVDYATDRLVMGTDPTGKTVTASALGQALTVIGKNVTVQGFGIRGYATAYDGERAALQMQNVGATVRNMHIQNNAMTGLAIQNNDSVVDNVTATGNGMLGIAVNAAYNSKFTDIVTSGNNVERFKAQPVAGGMKITRSRGITVDNVEVNKNIGMGLWLDESVFDFTVTNVQANNNTSAGIHAELSEKGIIANNEALNNKTGILIFDTGNVKIYNNDLGGNSLMGLQLSQDERRQNNKKFAGQDPRQPFPDNTTPWLTRNIEVSNNVFDKSGSFQFYALDKATNIPVDKMNVDIKGNLFTARQGTSTATMVAWGGSDNKQLSRYETPAALAKAKDPTWKNNQTSTAQTLSGMTADRAKAATVAVPLPADVAQAVGSKTGAKVVGQH